MQYQSIVFISFDLFQFNTFFKISSDHSGNGHLRLKNIWCMGKEKVTLNIESFYQSFNHISLSLSLSPSFPLSPLSLSLSYWSFIFLLFDIFLRFFVIDQILMLHIFYLTMSVRSFLITISSLYFSISTIIIIVITILFLPLSWL